MLVALLRAADCEHHDCDIAKFVAGNIQEMLKARVHESGDVGLGRIRRAVDKHVGQRGAKAALVGLTNYRNALRARSAP